MEQRNGNPTSFRKRTFQEETNNFSKKVKEPTIFEEYYEEIVPCDQYFQSNSQFSTENNNPQNMYNYPNSQDLYMNSSNSQQPFQVISNESNSSFPQNFQEQEIFYQEDLNNFPENFTENFTEYIPENEYIAYEIPQNTVNNGYEIIETVDLSNQEQFQIHQENQYFEEFQSEQIIDEIVIDDGNLEPIDGFYSDEYSVENNVSMKKATKKSAGKNQINKENLIRRTQGRQCFVCLKLKKEIRRISSEDDKLIIMIGCILRDEFTIEQAKQFMNVKHRLQICRDHFSGAIHSIYSELHIRNSDALSLYSLEMMQDLMVTVNALRPKSAALHFRTLLKNFAERYQDFIQLIVPSEIELNTPKPITHVGKDLRTSGNNENQSGRTFYKRCSICYKTKEEIDLKYVSIEDDKLIIMIGCLLRGDYTLEEAQSFVSNKKSGKCCHIHLSQSIDEIYKALNIKNLDEVSSCSTDLMQNLMITVNNLKSNYETWKFRTNLNKFFVKNKNFLGMISSN